MNSSVGFAASAPKGVQLEEIQQPSNLSRKRSAVSDTTSVIIKPQPPRLSIGIKVASISILALLQLVLLIVKLRHEGEGSWGVWFMPTWIVHLLFAIYFLYHLSKWSPGYEPLSTTASSARESRWRAFLSSGWKVLFWIASLIFFAVLAAHLDANNGSLTLHDGESLVFVWIAYFTCVLLLVIFYGINKWCCTR